MRGSHVEDCSIFGFMQVKAQAIINAMQFARDRPMMELEFATSADHLSFDFRDVLYNNDSRYRNIMLDEMIGTLSLKDSEPFATFHNLGDHLKKSAKYFYVSEYINVTDANVDEMAEFLRQVMTQEEVEVRMKTTEKVKMKLPGLPKYPITWDKTLYINGEFLHAGRVTLPHVSRLLLNTNPTSGAGGIDTFKPGGIGSAVLFNFSGLGFVGPSRQRGNDNMTYNFQLAGTLQTPGIRGFTRELDGTYAELTDYFKKSTLALKLPKVDVDVFDENAALIGNGSFQRTVLSAEEDPGMLRALLDAAVVEELAQVAGKDGVEPVVKVWHVEPRTVRLTENWDGSGDEVVCEALTKAMEGMRIEVKVNVTEAVEAMRESDEWYEENTIWD